MERFMILWHWDHALLESKLTHFEDITAGAEKLVA